MRLQTSPRSLFWSRARNAQNEPPEESSSEPFCEQAAEIFNFFFYGHAHYYAAARLQTAVALNSVDILIHVGKDRFRSFRTASNSSPSVYLNQRSKESEEMQNAISSHDANFSPRSLSWEPFWEPPQKTSLQKHPGSHFGHVRLRWRTWFPA